MEQSTVFVWFSAYVLKSRLRVEEQSEMFVCCVTSSQLLHQPTERKDGQVQSMDGHDGLRGKELHKIAVLPALVSLKLLLPSRCDMKRALLVDAKFERTGTGRRG